MKKTYIFILSVIFIVTLVGCTKNEDSKFEGIVEDQQFVTALFEETDASKIDFCYVYYLSKTQNKDFLEVAIATYNLPTISINSPSVLKVKVLRNSEIVKLANYDELFSEEKEQLIPQSEVGERYSEIGEEIEQMIAETYEYSAVLGITIEQYLNKRNIIFEKKYQPKPSLNSYHYYVDLSESSITKWYNWIIDKRNNISSDYHQTLMNESYSKVNMDYYYSEDMLEYCSDWGVCGLNNNIDLFIIYYEVVTQNTTFLDVMCNSNSRKVLFVKDNKLVSKYASELTESERESILNEKTLYNFYNKVKDSYFKSFVNDITILYEYYQTGTYVELPLTEYPIYRNHIYFELNEENVNKWYNIIQTTPEVWDVTVE